MSKKLTRGEKVLEFIARYCLIPEGSGVGKPLILEPFQKQFILDVYDNPHGTNRAYLSIARKNGKTVLIAALVLAHVCGSEKMLNAQIISGAMSRDQAALVFNAAEKMVRLSPVLSKLVRIVPSKKELHGLVANTVYRAISAEASTAHGLSPRVAILDEVGQVRGSHSSFIEAIETAQGAYNDPLLIAISTQASTDGDLFSIWLDDAKTGRSPKIVSHLYAANPDCELDNEKEWRAANPALGKFCSYEKFQELAGQAKAMPSFENSFRWLHLNQRIEADSPFVSRGIWQQCEGAGEIPENTDVFVGIDLSQVQDLTAIGVLGKVKDKWWYNPYFWLPEIGISEKSRLDRVPYDLWAKQEYIELTPSKAIDFLYPAHKLLWICEYYGKIVVSYDRYMFAPFKESLKQVGFTFDDDGKKAYLGEKEIEFREFRQGFLSFAPALNELERDLIENNLLHNANPVMNMCAANAIVKSDPAGNRKLDKSKREKRIDGMVTLAMARGVAVSTDVKSDDVVCFYNYSESLYK